jgi:tricorn protease-like protein
LVVGGVRYSAPEEAMGFVVATAADTGQELWRVRIYEVRFIAGLERDVQTVFITALKADGANLVVTNERGGRYSLDLKTHKVTRL